MNRSRIVDLCAILWYAIKQRHNITASRVERKIKMAERNMVNLTITITWEERKALKQVALDKDMTVSALPREWLKEYQKRRQSSNGEELTDQALRNAVSMPAVGLVTQNGISPRLAVQLIRWPAII